MAQPQIDIRLFRNQCDELISRFFQELPDPDFQTTAVRALDLLCERQHVFSGSSGGWMGGILYGLHRWMRCGKPIMNADLERVMGASMGTIRRRSEQVRQLIEQDIFGRVRDNKRWPRLIGEMHVGGSLVQVLGWVDADGNEHVEPCVPG